LHRQLPIGLLKQQGQRLSLQLLQQHRQQEEHWELCSKQWLHQVWMLLQQQPTCQTSRHPFQML
jgi:hypothetical protein